LPTVRVVREARPRAPGWPRMRKRKPFRLKKGCWVALCTPCHKAVHSYNRGGWGDLFDPLKCDRCGDEATVEFYPLFARDGRE